MQKAIVTIVVNSGGKEFKPNSTEIFHKADQLLKMGKYTVDIIDIQTGETLGEVLIDGIPYEMVMVRKDGQ